MTAAKTMRGVPEAWDRGGLPVWAYGNAELTALEKEVVFRRNWLCAGHVSELPGTGDYLTFEAADERALLVRGAEGEIRAFHNLCRHRGARVVGERQGHCRRAFVCPFHAWSYNLDGTLRAIATPQSFPDLDKAALGLKPLACELWQGFLFVRFAGEGPSVADTMQPYADEIAPYRLGELAPDGDYWEQEVAFNWKVAMDIDNEGYHVPKGHPMLQQLYGATYYDDFTEPQVARSFGSFRPAEETRLWSVRHYLKLLPEVTQLPASHRRAWLYYGLFPSCSLSLYPDLAEFYQVLPLDAGRSLMRGRRYALPDGRREMRAARYLNTRINQQTAEEDYRLMTLFAEGMRSSAFDDLILSDLEYGVRAYHDRLRTLLPVLTLKEAPPPGRLAEANAELGELI